jgi:hypothetical protein
MDSAKFACKARGSSRGQGNKTDGRFPSVMGIIPYFRSVVKIVHEKFGILRVVLPCLSFCGLLWGGDAEGRICGESPEISLEIFPVLRDFVTFLFHRRKQSSK